MKALVGQKNILIPKVLLTSAKIWQPEVRGEGKKITPCAKI